MPLFDYKAKDKKGNTVVGVVEAPTDAVAADVLEDRNLILLSLSERKKTTFFQGAFGFLNRVKSQEVVIFTRQLAVMISATVPIVRALRVLVKQTKSVAFKIIISEIADEVDGGARFSAALARYPQVFGDFFIHMVRSGETTGRLDDTLNYLADQKEKDYDLANKIRGAMIYPIFILCGLFGVGIIMMVFVIPKLTEVLSESGATLPMSTRILIGVSGFLQRDWWMIIIFLIFLVIFYKTYTKSEQGRKQADRFRLKMPIFGNLFQKIYLTRFSRSLSNLVASGVPLTKSLEIVADVVGNSIYRDLTLKTIQEVEAGNSIAAIYSQSPEVPVMLSQMLAVGEQTGKLDQILNKLADFYAREVETMVANLVSLIEPFVMVLLGGGVGVLVSSILLPMYNLSTSI